MAVLEKVSKIYQLSWVSMKSVFDSNWAIFFFSIPMLTMMTMSHSLC